MISMNFPETFLHFENMENALHLEFYVNIKNLMAGMNLLPQIFTYFKLLFIYSVIGFTYM